MAGARRMEATGSRSSTQGPPVFVRALSAVIGLALVLGILIGAWRGLDPLRDYTRDGLQAQSDSRRIQINWPIAQDQSTWVPVHVQTHLQSEAEEAMRSHSDPLSADGLRAVADAMARSGWLSEVSRVRREHDQVLIEGRWRVPWAVVRWRGRDQLIARDGAVLSESFDADTSGFRVLEGVALEPPMRTAPGSGSRELAVGELWPGDDVRDGLALLATLSKSPWWDQVRAIDVSEKAPGDQSPKLVIVSRFGGRIVWGAAPDRFRPWEQPVDVKLQRLDYLAASRGRIDAGESLVYIAGEKILIDRPHTVAQSVP